MNQAKPTISIIMPACNSEAVIGDVLDALNRQTAGLDAFEVVVVDDGSQDTTADIVRERAGGRLAVRFFKRHHAGRAATRNFAITHACAGLLLFLDSDVVPHEELVEQHIRSHGALAENECCAVLGRIALPPWREVPPLMRHDALPKWETINGRKELPWQYFCTGNVSVSKAIVEAAGGFDESLPRFEDTELGYRLGKRGLKIIYNSDAVGFHVDEINVDKYIEKAKVFGQALAALAVREPELASDLCGSSGRVWQGSLGKTVKRLAKVIVVNRLTAPLFAAAARFLEPRHGVLSAWLITKTYMYFFRHEFKKTRQMNRRSTHLGNT